VTGIAFDGDGVPEPGAAVSRDGADVGTVTVAVRSSLFDRVLGLALIDGALAASPGTRVQAGGSAGEIAALPFHDPQRARPRA
jgi:glycine cleavage system aminomethyltransferase T